MASLEDKIRRVMEMDLAGSPSSSSSSPPPPPRDPRDARRPEEAAATTAAAAAKAGEETRPAAAAGDHRHRGGGEGEKDPAGRDAVEDNVRDDDHGDRERYRDDEANPGREPGAQRGDQAPRGREDDALDGRDARAAQEQHARENLSANEEDPHPNGKPARKPLARSASPVAKPAQASARGLGKAVRVPAAETAQDSARQKSPSSERPPPGAAAQTASSAGATARPGSPGAHLYERALRQRAEMERKRQEAIQREATFSPQLISSKKKRENRATTPGKSRYDMLYADAASRQAQLQRKAHEKEACSFTPKTNWSRKSANGSTPGSGARKGADSPARRSDSLYANAKTLQEKRKSLAENRLREEAKECSFKPQISARAKAKRADSPGPTVRMNQLYEEAKAKEARIAAAQARRELEGCTFQPNINLRRRSSGAAGAPTPSPGAVQERLTRYQKESDRRREQLRQEQLAKEQQELTFQPNIIAAPGASKRPSTPQRAPSQAAIHERLYGEAARQQQQREGGSSAGESSASAKRRAPSPGVFDRLSTPKQPAAQDATREERLAIQELKECTFTPNTRPGSASRARRASAGGSAAGGSGSASGSSTPFWDRLARESEGVREIREEMRKQRELSECTFRPKLNRDASVSSKATNGSESGSSKKSATPIWDRLNEEAKLAKAREEELARKKEADELAACTFKPQISASAQGAKDAKASKPIWDRLADTKALDAKHEALERQREEAALKDCTFMPQTAPPASAASPPTGVKSPKSPPAASSSGAKKGLSYLDRVAAQSKPASASSSSSKPVAPKAGSAVPKVDDSPLVASDSPPVAKDSPLVANGAAKTSAAIKETSNGAVGAPMDDKPNDAVPESTLAAAPAAPAARPAPAQNSGSARLNLEQKIANIMIEAEADDEGNA